MKKNTGRRWSGLRARSDVKELKMDFGEGIDQIPGTERWGEPQALLRSLPNHLVTAAVHVPEGLVCMGSCRVCGGRDERLVVLPASMQPAGRQEVAKFALPVLDDFGVDLLRNHERCVIEPRKHPIPPLLTRLLAELQDSERRVFLRTGSLTGSFYLLFGDGERIIAEAPRWSGDPDLDRKRISLFKFLLRAAVRSQPNDLTAVLAFRLSPIAEADPSGPLMCPARGVPRGTEALVLEYATPSNSAISIAPITLDPATKRMSVEKFGAIKPAAFSPVLDTLVAGVH